jgi:hypothetical protein
VSSHAARSVPDGQSDAARGPLPPPTAVAAETAAHARAEPGGGVAGQSACGSVPKTECHGSSSRPQSNGVGSGVGAAVGVSADAAATPVTTSARSSGARSAPR